MRRALILLILLVAAAPAQAQSLDRGDRATAERALAKVERLLDGRGVRNKRELTPALVELVRSKSDLDADDRRRAARLLARPSDGTGIGAWTAPEGDETSMCTAHFCFHWVTSTSDRPLDGDADIDSVPDYVEFMTTAFEHSYGVEVGTLGWTAPLPDGGRGGSNLLDVYISDIGEDAYGYAVPESNARSAPSYLVLDNDYRKEQFAKYAGDYTVPVEATAAHEFNHALQFVYDNYQDVWMLESTATWAEDKVFDAANDYVSYLKSWARESDEPITSVGDDPFAESDDLKMYGSAIWNHWLDGIYGPGVVRQAWANSQGNSVAGGGFAPLAYDRAIRNAGGPGFAAEFATFSASSAEWDAANSGIREGATFPEEVTRRGTLTPGGATETGFVDHTAFALYDVPVPTGTGDIHLTGGLPVGTAGAIALVGIAAGSQTRTVGLLDPDGRVTVTIPDAGRFSNVTAVVVNTDTSNAGFPNNATDWAWTRDAQLFSLTATTGPRPAEPTPTATATATATPTVTPPPPPPPPATSLTLSRSSTRIRSVARTGLLALFARTNKAGRLTAKSSVDRATARRLRIGRRTTSTGTGRRTAASAGRFKVNVRLTRKARAALQRQTRRTLRTKVRVTLVPADGTSAVTRTISLLLRP